MDSQEKDQMKIRQREEVLARRIGEALDRLKPREAAECPDAEIIAAYSEQSLGADELTHWENHFATCARCRKILRVLAASCDAPLAEKEVARLGELVSTIRAPVEITRGAAGRVRPERVDWRTRWLAPALGVAAVLAVWFAMRPPWRATDRGASENLIAQGQKAELPISPPPATFDRLSKAAPRQEQEKMPATPPALSSAKTLTLNSPVESKAKGSADAASRLDSVAPGAEELRNSLQADKKSGTAIARNEVPAHMPPVPSEEQAQGASASPAAPPPQASAATSAGAPSRVPTETNTNAIASSGSRDKETPAPQLAAGAMTAPQMPTLAPESAPRRQSATNLKTTEPATIQATAPFGSTVWRMGKGGRIERSADAGETWVPQTSPSQEDWLAAVAVSDTVCWAAGRNGSIARTVDGDIWQRVAPPAQGAGADGKLPDWTGITARDAGSATIVASNGRKFATADGGETWKAQ